MRNKGAILFLTVLITGICLFYLSFSWKKMGLETEINEYVEQGAKDSISKNPKLYETSIQQAALRKRLRRVKQAEFDSTATHLGFNYNEINEYSLNLGLDLQGGVHVTLVVSAVDMIEKLAPGSSKPEFKKALQETRKRKRTDNRTFSTVFSETWTDLGNEKEDLLKYFLGPDASNEFDAQTKFEDIIDYIDTELESGLDRAVEILRNRVDEFGTTQPIITANYSAGRIEVEVPGADEEESIKRKIQSVAQLQFCEVWERGYDSEYDRFLRDLTNYMKEERKSSSTDSKVEEDSTGVEEQELFGDPEDQTNLVDLENPEDTTASVDEDTSTSSDQLFVDDQEDEKDKEENVANQERRTINPYFYQSQQDGNFYAYNKDSLIAFFQRTAVKKLMPKNMTILWDRGRNSDGKVDKNTQNRFYFVKRGPGYPPALTGDAIKDASQGYDERGNAAVDMAMKPKGAADWAEITRENQKQRIAVILDDKVYSAPVVQNEITGGRSQITGNFSTKEAKDLANILRAGELPAPTEIEQMVFVGPTLGKEAIDRGLMSLLCGLGLVIVFMIAYYNKGGLVANLALFFNILFILGVLSVPDLGATLTLPGIAGIVLTIGMAIDANVLIFERIREELRLGKQMNNAVAIGYQKAFWTIVDSNVTTLITAVLLASAGTGLVKGFGITLIIGICCSFFSSVYITRLFVEAMIKNRDKPKISFTTVISKKLFQNANFGIIKHRKKAYLFSLAVIIAGISIISTSGLNLGVEFTGGRSYVIKFNKDVAASEVKSNLIDEFEGASMIVKTFDGNDRVRLTTSYMADADMSTEEIDAIITKKLNTALKKTYDDANPIIEQSSSTAPTMAYEIRITALWSMIYALIAIFFYILIRFNKWQFSVGAIFALFHDVMFVLAMFAIVGVMGITYELDEVFVAAVLTIIGYSINDTVVVFDRVREFLRLNPKTGLAQTLNNSINSTMSRTLMTSLTTMLVVAVLLIFGGEALRGFSFALFIGVLVGTYSSIFIATPIVLDTTNAGKDGKQLFEEKKQPEPETV